LAAVQWWPAAVLEPAAVPWWPAEVLEPAEAEGERRDA